MIHTRAARLSVGRRGSGDLRWNDWGRARVLPAEPSRPGEARVLQSGARGISADDRRQLQRQLMTFLRRAPCILRSPCLDIHSPCWVSSSGKARQERWAGHLVFLCQLKGARPFLILGRRSSLVARPGVAPSATEGFSHRQGRSALRLAGHNCRSRRAWCGLDASQRSLRRLSHGASSPAVCSARSTMRGAGPGEGSSKGSGWSAMRATPSSASQAACTLLSVERDR